MPAQTTIKDVEDRVLSMYERHPFPAYSDKFRKTAEEMDLKMRLLGIPEADFTGKRILDCGCGTGEFTCWYASRGNHVTGVDLSRPSLKHAEEYARRYDLGERTEFRRGSVLDLDLPDDSFDMVYSYGVLHHTADPLGGFREMVRVCKPGGIVAVSVYSRYSRSVHAVRRAIIRGLAGDDVEKRFRWGKRLFPFTARKLKLRAHDESDAVLYDQFSIPHESLHTAGEVIDWMDEAGLEYLGAFGPLRIRDYLYAATLPEYETIETTFDGYPLARLASGSLKALAKMMGMQPRPAGPFPRPSALSRALVQIGWMFLGLRFSCFTIAARKPADGEA